MIKIFTSFIAKPIILSKLGVLPYGKVQKYVDNEVIKRSTPYVPYKTGNLANSAREYSSIGSGMVIWKTPYAKKQYYKGKENSKRGRLWFERMKADHKESILAGARKIAGGGTWTL